MSSIRRRLLGTLFAAVAASTLAAAFGVYRLERAELDGLLDYNLRQIALSLRHPAVLLRGAPLEAQGFDFVIQIWDLSGAKLYQSRPGASLPGIARLGFSNVASPAGEWRAFTAVLGDAVVEVAQPLRMRQELAFAAVSRTLAPMVATLPLLALLVWWIVGRTLAPLERLAGAVGARSPSALAPIPEEGAPEEALPLVRSLNDLLRRLGAALSAQRAFVADAAHELRTPLAALTLQLRLAEQASEAGDRASALADLRAGLERTSRVVQQLLTLARAEPDAAGAVPDEPVSLAELARQAVADHAPLAEARRIDLGATELNEEAAVEGDPSALRALLANLVDNAIRYTPEGGRVDVAARMAQGRPALEVADNGAGIPEADRSRVFDRFYRRAGSPGAGSGLGLSIVKAIAERRGAAVELLDTPGGGLTVRVTFQAPSSKGAAPEPVSVAQS